MVLAALIAVLGTLLGDARRRRGRLVGRRQPAVQRLRPRQRDRRADRLRHRDAADEHPGRHRRLLRLQPDPADRGRDPRLAELRLRRRRARGSSSTPPRRRSSRATTPRPARSGPRSPSPGPSGWSSRWPWASPGCCASSSSSPTDWPPSGEGAATSRVRSSTGMTGPGSSSGICGPGSLGSGHDESPAPARADGRADDQLRPITITRHWLDHAAGSVLVEFGGTKVLCAASASEGVPRWRKGSGLGWVTAEYAMLPAVDQHPLRPRVGQGPHRRPHPRDLPPDRPLAARGHRLRGARREHHRPRLRRPPGRRRHPHRRDHRRVRRARRRRRPPALARRARRVSR